MALPVWSKEARIQVPGPWNVQGQLYSGSQEEMRGVGKLRIRRGAVNRWGTVTFCSKRRGRAWAWVRLTRVPILTHAGIGCGTSDSTQQVCQNRAQCCASGVSFHPLSNPETRTVSCPCTEEEPRTPNYLASRAEDNYTDRMGKARMRYNKQEGLGGYVLSLGAPSPQPLYDAHPDCRFF